MSVPALFEARFFFADDASQMFEAKMLGNAIVTDRSDDNLRETARKMIIEDSSGEARKLVETKLVVVDVGVSKECGGLGASHPDDTIILFRP